MKFLYSLLVFSTWLCLSPGLEQVTNAEANHLTAEDFKAAVNIQEEDIDVTEGADGKFEGDMDLAGKSLEYYTQSFPLRSDGVLFKTGIRDIWYRWKEGVIPYIVHKDFTRYERSRIANAITIYHSNTCLRFVPRTTERDYIYFVKDIGCWSFVGRRRGQQKLSLASGCVSTGIILHELMHAVGFFHEQSRSDRDDYIEVVEANIIDGREKHFQKYDLDRITHLGTSYDYSSVMHYRSNAFSKNGLPTIKAPRPIGQRKSLSSTDILKVNRMYNCNDKTSETTDTPPNTSTSRVDDKQDGYGKPTTKKAETFKVATRTPQRTFRSSTVKAIKSTTAKPWSRLVCRDNFPKCVQYRAHCDKLHRYCCKTCSGTMFTFLSG